jgi:hypothetical protein
LWFIVIDVSTVLEDTADFVILLYFKFKVIDANGFAVEKGVVFVCALIRVSYKAQAVFKIYTVDIFMYGLTSFCNACRRW